MLSTCNRTEVYAVAERFHGAYADIRDFFCELGGVAPEDLHPHLYSQHDDAAIAHLFEVAAGLDSAVLGETEILGQVRGAWEQAQAEGGARSTLNLLFRHALETGKRARTETAISRSTASVSSRRGADGHRAARDARRAARARRRRRRDGRGRRRRARRCGCQRHRRHEPHPRAGDHAGRPRRRVGRSRTRSSPPRSREADVLVTCSRAGTVVIDEELVRSARHGVADAAARRRHRRAAQRRRQRSPAATA